jgi:prepilin-type N-terminal cleavage/methylation domain-containing protein
MKKRAFTLIELLVVIAIIAILAAILFPVFAQAKVAAKGAASTSNAKQIALASLIYAADYNDQPPLGAIIEEQDAPWQGIKPWSYVMLPYMKTANLFQDPLAAPYKPGSWNDIDGYSFFTQFAYAWQVHAPGLYYGGPYVNWKTISQTELGNPAETVLMFTKQSADLGSQWWWGSTFGIVTWWTAGVPICPTGYTGQVPQSLCGPGLGPWGFDGVSGSQSYPLTEGRNTSNFAYRKAGKGVVAYGDGHVTITGPGHLSKGTNWTPLIHSDDMVITDQDAYMWDIL